MNLELNFENSSVIEQNILDLECVRGQANLLSFVQNISGTNCSP